MLTQPNSGEHTLWSLCIHTLTLLSLFLCLRLLTTLEVVHTHLGGLISAKEKPSHFTGPSRLRNASVKSQKNICKTFTLYFPFWQHANQRPSQLWQPALKGQMWQYHHSIHIVNLGVFSMFLFRFFLAEQIDEQPYMQLKHEHICPVQKQTLSM